MKRRRLCHLDYYPGRMVVFSRFSQYGPDVIRPVERMGFGVFLLRVRFGLPGTVNPVEQQETFVSVRQNLRESLANYLFFAFTSQGAKGS